MVHRLLRLFGLVWLALHAAAPWAATAWVERDADGAPAVHLYFFWTPTCPHCTDARRDLGPLVQARPWLRLHAYDLTQDDAHAALYRAMARELGEQAAFVPALFFCGRLQVGWGRDAAEQLARELDACRDRFAQGDGRGSAAATSAQQAAPLRLPLLGAVDPQSLSLPALTAVLAALDAFNPCAFFVLLFLLSLLTHQRQRSRMALIGGVFVLTSGLMYFAFMAAWLNVFALIGHLKWVTLAAGALALAIGAINVKDFFAFERGVTLSIPESRKPDIFRRARLILSAPSLPAMLAATILLAVAVNFYELLCTAGFPLVYTRILTLADVSGGMRYAYLAAYNLIYVVPLALIVLLFVRTLGARKLTEREGRLLKLMSGLMMLGLGGLLVLAPDLLNRLWVTVALLAAAVGSTWVAARFTRAARAH
jgi:glutaredoxin